MKVGGLKGLGKKIRIFGHRIARIGTPTLYTILGTDDRIQSKPKVNKHW